MIMNLLPHISQFFHQLKPIEIAEYLTLAVLAIVVPWSWELAVKFFVALFIIAILRVLSSRHIGNPSLTSLMRWALIIMAAFYLWNGVSIFWSDDYSSALGFMETRLPLLLLPLMMLVADTTYLNPLRRRGILYALCTSLVVKFLFLLVKCLLTGVSINQLPTIDTVHYSYSSIYLLVALAYIYSEWSVRFRGEKRTGGFRQASIIYILYSIVFISYIILSTSRTGVLGLVLFFIFVIIHLIVSQHKICLGLLIFFTAIPLAIGIHYMLPQSARRVTITIEKLKNNKDSDARVGIYKCSYRAAIDNLPFGTGLGDGQKVLNQYYIQSNYEWSGFNCHNIYLDSFLTLGIPGIFLLLAMLFLPLVDAVEQHNPQLMILLLVIIFVGLFESIFSRQLGLMFFASLFYATASSTELSLTH